MSVATATKGKALPKPQEVVAKRKAKRLLVHWYGSGWRTVEVFIGIELRW